MYKTDEAFTAESHGLVVGKAYGLRQGYDEGWNAAIAHVQPQYDAALREQRELAYALNALSVIAYSALAALKAAAPPGNLLGTIPPEMVGKFQDLKSFMGSEEGKASLAAFAAGDDAAVDMVKRMAKPTVDDMVKKIPADRINLVGRSVDLLSDLLIDALKERLEEAEQPELVPVPDPVATPAARQHPLKKGKPRRVNRHGSLDELGDLIATGELRVRAA